MMARMMPGPDHGGTCSTIASYAPAGELAVEHACVADRGAGSARFFRSRPRLSIDRCAGDRADQRDRWLVPEDRNVSTDDPYARRFLDHHQRGDAEGGDVVCQWISDPWFLGS